MLQNDNFMKFKPSIHSEKQTLCITQPVEKPDQVHFRVGKILSKNEKMAAFLKTRVTESLCCCCHLVLVDQDSVDSLRLEPIALLSAQDYRSHLGIFYGSMYRFSSWSWE